MSEVNVLYSNLLIDYEVANDQQSITQLPYTQLDTLITNRLFTPDNLSTNSPEDLQIRVSKNVKFFLGEHDGAVSTDYSLQISEIDQDTASIETRRSNLNMTADYLNMNSLIINDTAAAVKASTNKVLQIHSANKIQMIGKVEFSNEVKMDKNLYIGKSLIFFDEEYGDVDTNQIRIGLQYNQAKDTLDIVKQKGSGGTMQKKLMARLGQGTIFGNDASLIDVPYYSSPQIASASFTTGAPVFNAANIWKQSNTTLYYGQTPGEKIGIGLSAVTEKFEVVGTSKINDIYLDTDNDISGVNVLTADNIVTNSITIATDTTLNGTTTADSVALRTINFTTNPLVGSFNGNMSTLNNDVATWLQPSQNQVLVSDFSNDSAFISKLQEVTVNTKWRFKEVGEELHIEKNGPSGWEQKFKFN
jgi:hypothetical protein